MNRISAETIFVTGKINSSSIALVYFLPNLKMLKLTTDFITF